MEKQPKFIKEFSKQNSQEERDALAHEIREKRKKYFSDSEKIRVQEAEKSELLKSIEELSEKIESYNDESFFLKVRDFFAIKKVQNELNEKTGKHSSTEEELEKSIAGREDLEETRKMVADFYVAEKKKWNEMPWSKEDVKVKFTEENLSSLSMEEYVELMRKFPGEMLTHVTRHGVRDHADLGNHQKGLGERQDSFRKVLQKKELRSALGIALQESSKEEAIANILELNNCPSRKIALGRIVANFKTWIQGDPNAFADMRAVHLAAEEVADRFYGGESGNEIFVAYPSVFIASQYEFSGKLNDSGNNNDQFIWPNIDKGIPIDAGIVFVPGDARVDVESGSKYQLNENGSPIPSEGIEEIFNARFGEIPGFVQDAMKHSDKFASLSIDERKRLSRKIFEKYGIKNEGAIEALADFNLLVEISKVWGSDEEKSEYIDILIKHFQNQRLGPYKLVERAITSKEYWEKYFQENPELCPKHVVYYSGGDPSKALHEWKRKNSIEKTNKDGNMGFYENERSKEDVNADEVQQRFVSIARNLVDKRFSTGEENPSYSWSFRD